MKRKSERISKKAAWTKIRKQHSVERSALLRFFKPVSIY